MSRMYLQPLLPNQIKSDVWYKMQPLGKNSIGAIMREMSVAAGLSGRHTNHGGRRTMITNALDEGIDESKVMQLTGHKNVNSINEYRSLSHNQQKEISNVITKKMSKSLPKPAAALGKPSDHDLEVDMETPSSNNDAQVCMDVQSMDPDERTRDPQSNDQQEDKIDPLADPFTLHELESSVSDSDLMATMDVLVPVTTQPMVVNIPPPHTLTQSTNIMNSSPGLRNFLNSAVFNAPVTFNIHPK